MSIFEASFFPLCLVLGGIWLLILLLSVGGRALAKWRQHDTASAKRVLRDLQVQGVATKAQQQKVNDLLSRLPRRVLNRIAADASLPAGAAAIFSTHILSRRSVESLLQDARNTQGGLRKWRRVLALRVLAHAFSEGALDERIFGLLREASHSQDRDIADATVVILGSMRDKRAAEILVEALQNGASSQSRIAAQLDAFPNDQSNLLIPLLKDQNPSTRRWAATLLARYNDRTDIPQELAELANDENADVRSAVVSSLGYLASPPSRMHSPVHVSPEELRQRVDLVGQVAKHLTADESWFVRAQAARTLGELKRPELADAIIPLLSDSQWWVRQAAKDALRSIGSSAAPSIVHVLENSDRFARNSAAEVLQNIGYVDLVIQRLLQPQADAADMQLLQKIYQASGGTLLSAALNDVPDARKNDLWRIIRKASGSTESDKQSAETTSSTEVSVLNAVGVCPEDIRHNSRLSNDGYNQSTQKGQREVL